MPSNAKLFITTLCRSVLSTCFFPSPCALAAVSVVTTVSEQLPIFRVTTPPSFTTCRSICTCFGQDHCEAFNLTSLNATPNFETLSLRGQRHCAACLMLATSPHTFNVYIALKLYLYPSNAQRLSQIISESYSQFIVSPQELASNLCVRRSDYRLGVSSTYQMLTDIYR